MVAIPRNATHRWLWDAIRNGEVTLAVSTEILEEYAEVLGNFYSQLVAEGVLEQIARLPKLERVDTYFHFLLITSDPDDNKFVDCAIACGANYIITHDNHFKILKKVAFPKVRCLKIEQLKRLIER